MRFKKVLIFILMALLITGGYVGYDIYKKIFVPNVPKEVYLNIPTGANYIDVLAILIEKNVVKNKSSFDWLARKMKYDKNIHAGHYKITPGMNNKELIILLRSGKQTPVYFIFNNVRLPAELASVISRTIEADSASIMKLFNDDLFLKQY